MKYLAFLLLVPGIALAGNRDHTHVINVESPDVVIQPFETRTIETVVQRHIREYSNTAALNTATAQIHPSLSIQAWQFGAGFGYYNDSEALALGVAKRVNDSMLLNFTASQVNSKSSSTAIGAGVNWIMK